MTGYDPIFAEYESVVRSYPRSFPTTFTRAKGSIMYDSEGREFIDFFDGAGALNYGHNNDYIKDRVIDYLRNDGILHALDMQTVPKAEFIETLETKLLKPRGLNYKVMFCGPTGTNSIEAAEHSYAAGYRWLELDFSWTSDGELCASTTGATGGTARTSRPARPPRSRNSSAARLRTHPATPLRPRCWTPG